MVESRSRELTLGAPPSAPRISSHWDSFLVCNHIIQVGKCPLQFPAIDSLSRFSSVFE